MSDEWALAEGKSGRHRFIARWRTHLVVPDQARPVMVRAKFGFEKAVHGGMPSPADVASLEEIEETIFPELAANSADLVLVVTGRKAREFIAYANTADWLPAWGPSVMERWSRPKRPASVEALHDPDWQTFRMIVPG